MKNVLALVCLVICVCTGCKKQLVVFGIKLDTKITTTPNTSTGFLRFTIKKGLQYSDSNPFTTIKYQELRFSVRFDSSARYNTQLAANQADINKLYGFSDNNAQHHQYSARFGWRWSNNALRLFGYVYNAGVRTSQEIGVINIGQTYDCKIIVTNNAYQFYIEGKKIDMPRLATTPQAVGYKLYPYFGGDETAPHDIHIWIREEK